LYFSRNIIRSIPVRKMILAGHVGGQAVEMWGFHWRSLKESGYMEALVLDRVTALRRILKKYDVA